MPIDSKHVAIAHDAMAEEYDQIDGCLWYAWLYKQIHEFIARNLRTDYAKRPSALDAGCGTGLQSFLLSQAGFDVLGIDLAQELLRVANSKIPTFAAPPLKSPPLFECRTWKYINSHPKRLAKRLDQIRSGREVRSPTFEFGDIVDYDLGQGKYDVVVSCGSVLSFIESYRDALRKLAASLRVGGILFLEVEQKLNLDLIWPIIDNLSGGRLGYELTWKEIFANLFSSPSKSIQLDYPFELKNGEELILPIWLFAVADLSGLFRSCNLRVVDRLGVHWMTNLIPSTVLHKCDSGRIRTSAMTPLAVVDNRLGRCWPMHRLGCSALFALQKQD
jgi:MPBQ/MSBQ methyltransferase